MLHYHHAAASHIFFANYFFTQPEQFFLGLSARAYFMKMKIPAVTIISPLKVEIRALSSRDPTIALFFSPFHVRLFLDSSRLCGRRSQFREGLLAFSLSRLCVRAVRRHRRRRRCRRDRR